VGFREKIIIFGILPWLLAIVALFMLVIPSIKGNLEKSAILNDKQEELSSLNSSINKIKNTDKIEKEIEDLKISLLGFKKQFPDKDNSELVVVDIQNVVNELDVFLAGIYLNTLKGESVPKKVIDLLDDGKSKSKSKQKKKSVTIPFKISSKAIKINYISSFEDAIDFLNYLQNYYRFIDIEGIVIKKVSDRKIVELVETESGPKLAITLNFKIYTFEDLKVNDSEKDDSKKKK
jgi:hypothetical protein